MNPSSDRRMRTGWRSRWAAIGAAVAVSLGAGGFFIAEAASGPESSMVMIDPVRILDTRDPVNVGLPGPFVSPIAQKLQVSGSIPTSAGTQTVVPTGATGVLLNVTAVGATANGFISIRPGDATGSPATSSLNVTAGVTVPNAVQVALPLAGANAGKIDITWDALGVAGPTTDILIDVVAYTTDAKLMALQGEIDALAATVASGKTIMSSAHDTNVDPNPEGTTIVIATVTITAPVEGTIQMVGSTLANGGVATGNVSCRLTQGAGVTSNPESSPLADTDRDLTVAGGSGQGFCSTNGAIKVAAGTHVLNLAAFAPADFDLDDVTLDAIFAPGGTLTEAALTVADVADDGFSAP